ncbi:MAG: glycoside hydrolase family 31 protein [Cyclobacteriaceae bacterium]|nr:glycoside hydrolase family 31 protein [Cyclobacteriaceae bacterium]
MESENPSSLYQSAGNFQSFKQTQHGISVNSDNGFYDITFYSDWMFRITSGTQRKERKSYAVIRHPQAAEFYLENHDLAITLTGKHLKITLQKYPLRVSVSTTDGRIINQDDESFGTGWIGEQVTTYKKLQDNEIFIGLGEKTGPLNRKGQGYTNWNTDAFAYHGGTDPLYCSIPFYIGIHHGLAYGIFFDNSHKTFFNFGASNNRFASFSADSGVMDYYFIYGPTVADILREYTGLTGRMPLPPVWSLGYQQCRYSYYPEAEVMNVARTFREKQIPCDALVLDIHYMDNYKIFTWDKARFSDPQKMIEQLKSMGFEIVLMCDPGIKAEKGYEPYEDGIAKDVFLKYPDGTCYTGQVWPGWCHFPDFSKPETRAWWKEKLKAYTNLGVEGFWNDMNEIATWGNMLPELVEFNFDGQPTTMREGRNVYGLLMARSSYEGASALLNKRPFNLTRSGYAGVQRYAAVWTGDNVAYDEHMLLGVRLVNSLGLSGVAFAGYDVGGFVGNADTKLFTRWFSIGSFSPFFRGHTMINTRDSEPWTYGEEAEQICRNYARFRYRLLPYLYSVFYEASQTGMPVQRSLAIDFTHDPKIYEASYQNEYLFGPNLLVAPTESTRDITKLYLPQGQWYYLYNGALHSGNTELLIESPLHRLPVFVRAGAIIPMSQPGQNTREQSPVIELHLYAGPDSSFVFYQDDGETFRYRDNEFYRRSIRFSSNDRRLILEKPSGIFKPGFTTWKIIFHGFSGNPDFKLSGNPVKSQREALRLFEPLEKFDPIADPEPAMEEEVISLTLPESDQEIIIHW